MAKSKIKSVFECQACGARAPKWVGKCSDCGGWNTVSEVRVAPNPTVRPGWGGFSGANAGGPGVIEPVSLAAVEGGREPRFGSTIGELDRVLGGGVVEGSAVLVGGDPGIGKSTLLLQLMCGIAQKGETVLYVTGEESARQIRMRADRLGGPPESLLVLTEIDLEAIIASLDRVKPAVAVIDSVQTVASAEISGAPGTVSQVREASAKLISWAKGCGLPLFLVGHVTKDGALAGPRVLEHMVDTVLYFEGDRGHPFRILRAVKNRFGSTNEVGVFEMSDKGLSGVDNPSALFLSERSEQAAGSAVVSCLEGTRTLLVEVQALVAPQVFGTSQRTTSGAERNRVQIILALMDRRLGYALANHDVFVSVAGGLSLSEPAGDLGLVAALASAYRDLALPSQSVFFGEVGLSGEIRAVSRAEERVREAAKLGFARAYAPARQVKELGRVKGIELIGVSSLEGFVEGLWD
jgi:DNA repair protein RadA/Sms